MIWREVSVLLDRALTLYPAVVADAELPDGVALSYINWLATTFVEATKRERVVVEVPAVEAVIAARGEDNPLVHLVRAWFAVHSAWDVRGTDFARKVPEKAWPLFYTRLAHAEASVSEAVRAGSIEPAVPAIMMRVGVGLHADVGELNEWFAHGVSIEPGDRWWYEAKLDWLLPKWFGSHDEALAFARDAARSGNLSLNLSLLVEDAWRAESADHFPSEACDEVLAIYTALVERYPYSPSIRAGREARTEECRADTTR